MLKKIYLLVIGFILISSDLFASHYMGGEITWECLPNGNYRFIMKAYRECAGITYGNTYNMQTTIPNLPSIQMTLVSKTDISPDCYDPVQEVKCYPKPSASNTGAVEEWLYTSDTAYPNGVNLAGVPPPQGWEFYYQTCCRNPNVNIVSATSKGFRLRAIMYPYNNQDVSPCFDNSPQFEESPAIVLALGYPFTYNQLASDKELDSLAYKWGMPQEENATPVTYVMGYSYDNCLPGAAQDSNNVGATLNATTGEISFTCHSPQGAYVTVVKVEAWKNGIKVAEVFRDLQVVLLPMQPANNPPLVRAPFINPVTGQYTDYIDTVYAGDLVQFSIQATDVEYLPTIPQTPQTISYSALGMQFGANYTDSTTGCLNPPCATLSPPPPDSSLLSLSTSFNWQTTNDHLITDPMGRKRACTYNFGFKIQDDYCPIPGMTFKTVTIVVEPPPYDIGVVSIIEPDTQTIINNSVTVKALLKNFGITDLDSFDLEYTINGAVKASESWTGLLKPDSTMEYTFATQYLSPVGAYQLCVNAILPGDTDPGNDGKCQQHTGTVGINELTGNKFALGQNEPNPTGDKTRIEYYAPVPDKAVFKLKNSLGQQVLIREENAMAGINAIEINVSKLPVGLYYYSVEYKGERLSKKMIISR